MSNNKDFNRGQLLRELGIYTARAFDLYAAGEYAAAIVELDQLMESIPSRYADVSLVEILNYIIQYTVIGFQASLHYREPDRFLELANKLAVRLQLPAQTESGDAERRAIYLRFLTSMDCAGFDLIAAEEFEKLLKDVPENHLNSTCKCNDLFDAQEYLIGAVPA